MKDKRYQLLLDQLNKFQNNENFQKGQNNEEMRILFANFLSAQGQSNDTMTREFKDHIS